MLLVEGNDLKEVQDVKIYSRGQLLYILNNNHGNKEEVRELIKSIPEALVKIQLAYKSYEMMFKTYGIDLLDEIPYSELLYVVLFLPSDYKLWDLMF